MTDHFVLTAASGTPHITLSDPDPDTIAEAAVALANADGGVIAVSGPSGDALAEMLLQVHACCTPLIAFDPPQKTTTPDGPAWAIGVARGGQVHALSDGRVMVHAGKRLRALDGDEIRQLISARMAGDFETEIVPGANPSDLDAALLADYMLVREQRTAHDWHGDANTLLTDIGAVSSVGGVTVAGMLLFGRDPARWLPDSGARFIRVVGDHKAVNQTLDGPLIHVLHSLWDTLQSQIRTQDYPAEPLREALFNALCHRDYRLRDQRVTVQLFADRLEITSPGGLPGYLTTAQHMLGARYSRNPHIRGVLRVWDTHPRAGGVLAMIAAAGLHGHRPPEIEIGAYHVRVRLFSARKDANAGESSLAEAEVPVLTPCQQDILSYARANGSVTLHELRVRCNGISAAALGDALAELVAAGLLRRIGRRAKAYYILA